MYYFFIITLVLLLYDNRQMIYHIIGIATLLFLVCVYLNNKFGVKRLNLPGPIHLPIIGSFIEFLMNKHRFYDWIYDLAVKHRNAGIFYFSIPMKEPYIVLLRPEYVKHVLSDNMTGYHREPVYSICGELLGSGIFNADGDIWKQQRRIASHMFSTKNIYEKAYNTFMECSDKLVIKINKCIESDTQFDLKDLFFRTTMDSICKIAFDYDVGCLDSDEMPEFAKAIDWCTRYLFYRLLNPLWKIKKIANMPDEIEYKRQIEILNRLCYKIIDERRQKINNGNQLDNCNDLLSLFMKSGNYENEFLRDIIFSFIIAGRDTTASSLSWLFYELLKNPKVEEKIRDEIKSQVSDPTNLLADECKKLEYIEATFMETLRLHPPVPIDIKYAKENDMLPDSNILIPKDSIIMYSPYIFGRSPEIWGNTFEEFDPSRWIKNSVNYNGPKTNYEFLAFNAGHRVCLGKGFAKLEAQVIVTRLINKFKFTKLDNSNVSYSIGVTSTIKEELLMNAHLLD